MSIMRTSDTPIFEPPPALPRGPHQLTREQVAESQRTRLMAAFTELLAERGYAAVRIGDLATRAGVSRAAFYEHFADREACLLAAYDRFAAAVTAAITEGIDEQAPWSAFIEVTLDGYLRVLEGDPVAARAFIIEMDAAGPAARRRRREAMAGFAELLAHRHAQIRARDPSLGSLPKPAYLALVLAIRELVHQALENEKLPRFRDIAPAIVVLATAVVEGAAAANRLAGS
jgi:AcrR family transcriptional regulator